ncbi:MAG: 2-amino-4-hydroxy-6-hydroxymethyldihydropteridine diphosphokinase [Alphaproteobacteria bacterium]|nr:2-amino-4-hydroxy-6-hydroxymethyldihydropteridine diphosphokinase [Alphaproteobacteria bacterium]
MILIGIGANLPAPDGRSALQTCQAAAQALSALPGLRMVALSRWWATAAIGGPPDAPDFVNGVVRLEGAAEPEALLTALHAIEEGFGRARPYPNAPRTLDLDLLAMDALLREAAPILPHPRLHQRRFVLEPLLEVAPDWAHPRLGPAAALLAALPDQGTAPLNAESAAPLHPHGSPGR